MTPLPRSPRVDEMWISGSAEAAQMGDDRAGRLERSPVAALPGGDGVDGTPTLNGGAIKGARCVAADPATVPVETLDFCKECDRLKSFDKWAVPFVEKTELAAAGFYYTGCRDAVKCPFCSIGLANWVPGDQPLLEHAKSSPNCSYLQGLKLCKPGQQPEIGEDVCGPFDVSSRSENLYSAHNDSQSNRPKFPNYKSYEARLKTFENWQYSHKVPPDMLSLAGFVCKKIKDRTFCFHCGLEMYKWDDSDNPWVEHAHWSPNCKFVLSKKGAKFIDEARTKKHDELVHTQEAMKEAMESIRKIISREVNETASVNEKENAVLISSKGSQSQPINSDNQEQDREELASCLICLNNKRETVLLPCYHVVGCETCVKKLKTCCVCREPIIYWRKIFFS